MIVLGSGWLQKPWPASLDPIALTKISPSLPVTSRSGETYNLCTEFEIRWSSNSTSHMCNQSVHLEHEHLLGEKIDVYLARRVGECLCPLKSSAVSYASSKFFITSRNGQSLRYGLVFLELTRILSGIQFTRHFIEFVVVVIKRFVGSNVNVILIRQTCGQRSSRAAGGKRRALASYFFYTNLVYILKINM